MSVPSKSRARTARLVDGGLLLLVVGLLLWAVIGNNRSGLGQLAGEPAPPFKLKTMSGAVTGPPDHVGKLVLLDFWATWCNPCFKQMPAVHEVMQEYDDLVVLPVNVDEPSVGRAEAMKKFLQHAHVDLDSLIDDGSASALYHVETIPALVLIDPQGRIAYASSGVHTAKELSARIAAVKRRSR